MESDQSNEMLVDLVANLAIKLGGPKDDVVGDENDEQVLQSLGYIVSHINGVKEPDLLLNSEQSSKLKSPSEVLGAVLPHVIQVSLAHSQRFLQHQKVSHQALLILQQLLSTFPHWTILWKQCFPGLCGQLFRVIKQTKGTRFGVLSHRLQAMNALLCALLSVSAGLDSPWQQDCTELSSSSYSTSSDNQLLLRLQRQLQQKSATHAQLAAEPTEIEKLRQWRVDLLQRVSEPLHLLSFQLAADIYPHIITGAQATSDSQDSLRNESQRWTLYIRRLLQERSGFLGSVLGAHMLGLLFSLSAEDNLSLFSDTNTSPLIARCFDHYLEHVLPLRWKDVSSYLLGTASRSNEEDAHGQQYLPLLVNQLYAVLLLSHHQATADGVESSPDSQLDVARRRKRLLQCQRPRLLYIDVLVALYRPAPSLSTHLHQHLHDDPSSGSGYLQFLDRWLPRQSDAQQMSGIPLRSPCLDRFTASTSDCEDPMSTWICMRRTQLFVELSQLFPDLPQTLGEGMQTLLRRLDELPSRSAQTQPSQLWEDVYAHLNAIFALLTQTLGVQSPISPASDATSASGAQAVCAQCSKLPQKPLRCSRCKAVVYCSAQCQRRHWSSSHQMQCVPAKTPPQQPLPAPSSSIGTKAVSEEVLKEVRTLRSQLYTSVLPRLMKHLLGRTSTAGALSSSSLSFASSSAAEWATGVLAVHFLGHLTVFYRSANTDIHYEESRSKDDVQAHRDTVYTLLYLLSQTSPRITDPGNVGSGMMDSIPQRVLHEIAETSLRRLASSHASSSSSQSYTYAGSNPESGYFGSLVSALLWSQLPYVVDRVCMRLRRLRYDDDYPYDNDIIYSNNNNNNNNNNNTDKNNGHHSNKALLVQDVTPVRREQGGVARECAGVLRELFARLPPKPRTTQNLGLSQDGLNLDPHRLWVLQRDAVREVLTLLRTETLGRWELAQRRLHDRLGLGLGISGSGSGSLGVSVGLGVSVYLGEWERGVHEVASEWEVLTVFMQRWLALAPPRCTSSSSSSASSMKNNRKNSKNNSDNNNNNRNNNSNKKKKKSRHLCGADAVDGSSDGGVGVLGREIVWSLATFVTSLNITSSAHLLSTHDHDHDHDDENDNNDESIDEVEDDDDDDDEVESAHDVVDEEVVEEVWRVCSEEVLPLLVATSASTSSTPFPDSYSSPESGWRQRQTQTQILRVLCLQALRGMIDVCTVWDRRLPRNPDSGESGEEEGENTQTSSTQNPRLPHMVYRVTTELLLPRLCDSLHRAVNRLDHLLVLDNNNNGNNNSNNSNNNNRNKLLDNNSGSSSSMHSGGKNRELLDPAKQSRPSLLLVSSSNNSNNNNSNNSNNNSSSTQISQNSQTPRLEVMTKHSPLPRTSNTTHHKTQTQIHTISPDPPTIWVLEEFTQWLGACAHLCRHTEALAQTSRQDASNFPDSPESPDSGSVAVLRPLVHDQVLPAVLQAVLSLLRVLLLPQNLGKSAQTMSIIHVSFQNLGLWEALSQVLSGLREVSECVLLTPSETQRRSLCAVLRAFHQLCVHSMQSNNNSNSNSISNSGNINSNNSSNMYGSSSTGSQKSGCLGRCVESVEEVLRRWSSSSEQSSHGAGGDVRVLALLGRDLQGMLPRSQIDTHTQTQNLGKGVGGVVSRRDRASEQQGERERLATVRLLHTLFMSAPVDTMTTVARVTDASGGGERSGVEERWQLPEAWWTSQLRVWAHPR